MIYTHVLKVAAGGTASPLDAWARPNQGTSSDFSMPVIPNAPLHPVISGVDRLADARRDTTVPRPASIGP